MYSTTTDLKPILLDRNNWPAWIEFFERMLTHQEISNKVIDFMKTGTIPHDRVTSMHPNSIKDDGKSVGETYCVDPTRGFEVKESEVREKDPVKFSLKMGLLMKSASEKLECECIKLVGIIDKHISTQAVKFMGHDTEYDRYRKNGSIFLMWKTIKTSLKNYSNMSYSNESDRRLQAAIYLDKYSELKWDHVNEQLTDFYDRCELGQSHLEHVGVKKKKMSGIYASHLILRVQEKYQSQFDKLLEDDGMVAIQTYEDAKAIINTWAHREYTSAICKPKKYQVVDTHIKAVNVDNLPITPENVHASAATTKTRSPVIPVATTTYVSSNSPNTPTRKRKQPLKTGAERRKQLSGSNPVTETSSNNITSNKYCAICGPDSDHYISDCPTLNAEQKDSAKTSFELRKKSFKRPIA